MPRDPSVVVGFDGSGRARSALLWAAREAAQRGLPLKLVHATAYPAASAHDDRGPLGDGRVLEGGLRVAHTVLEEDRVSGVCVPGHPAGVLAAESSGAALLVVGQRSQDAPVSSAVGSTSLVLADRVRCPLVVARGANDGRRALLPVAVGVAPDRSSRAVLDFAASTARLRAVPLTIVSAWWLPPAAEWTRAAAGFESVAQWARALAARAAATARETERQVHACYPALETRTLVERRDPAGALVASSREAGLLVIGSGVEPCARSGEADRRRGLGRAGADVLGRAACPVVVVPDR
jgi:nucleotide-binding universal stress UspA family protein